MIIRKVNGNEFKDVKEVDIDYEDIIKTLFIIPVVEQWSQDYTIEGVSLEDLVDAIYDYFDISDMNELISDGIAYVEEENGWTEKEIDD